MLADLSILVVDDDVEFAEVLARRLTRRGARVSLCRTAGECLSALRNQIPDMVLSDRTLAGDDGLHLVRQIRLELPDLPVVMLSGHSDEASINAALGAGVTEYLSKPAPLAELEIVLARYGMAKNR